MILADRRFKLGHGRAFALYVAGYTIGRAWIENLRIDTADHVLGLRLNVWTSLIVFAAAVAFFIHSARTKPGQEDIRTEPERDDLRAARSRERPRTPASRCVRKTLEPKGPRRSCRVQSEGGASTPTR